MNFKFLSKGGLFDIVRLRKMGSMLLESSICFIIFIIVSIFMGNFIISTSKSILIANNVSSNVLRMRELEMFLNSEFDKYAFDFKVKSDNKLYYKKINPVDDESCEIKERELIFNRGTIRLEYDDRNFTNLLRNVDRFKVYAKDNLIFLNIELGGLRLLKAIPSMSYSI